MGSPQTRTSGRTLGFPWAGEGFADLRRRLDRYTLRRAALAGLAIGAFVAGVVSAATVLEGEVDPGLVGDSSGSRVATVVQGGYAWRVGVRAGQQIVAIRAADDPGGWRIETSDGVHSYIVDAVSADGALAATWPLAAGALGAGALALLLLRARRRWVLPAAAVAFTCAAPPLLQSGTDVLSTLVAGAAMVVPAGWATWRLPGGVIKTSALSVASAGFLGAWALGRFGASPGLDTLEWVRGNLAAWGTVAMVLDYAIAARSGGPMLLTRPRPFDVAALAVVAGGALALVSFFALPPLAIAGIALAAVLAIPTLRRRLRPLENVLLSDIRAQAAAEATERERGRLARELHDVPLQELFGIIRRLEVKPGTEAESDDLRALAGHLRNVAIDLRPPVLDDLGLPAALEYLAEGATSPGFPVVAEIADNTGLGRAQRPPEQVELAMFRVAMEAVANAVAHSGASQIRVVAGVQPRRVELQIVDDGAGLNAGVARAAVRRRHMGLNSMHRRADAIDADFSIKADSSGTTIQVIWQG
jgi:signal transduction histidine kinase